MMDMTIDMSHANISKRWEMNKYMQNARIRAKYRQELLPFSEPEKKKLVAAIIKDEQTPRLYIYRFGTRRKQFARFTSALRHGVRRARADRNFELARNLQHILGSTHDVVPREVTFWSPLEWRAISWALRVPDAKPRTEQMRWRAIYNHMRANMELAPGQPLPDRVYWSITSGKVRPSE